MEILSSRVIVRPVDPEAARHFYSDVLGLAVSREFGPPEHPGLVFFTGQGLLELSGRAEGDDRPDVVLWLQVRDVAAAHEELRAAGVPIVREPRVEAWGLVEMWVRDPGGLPVVIVEVPPDHPLRRDQR